MPFKLADFIWETVTSPGSGAFDLNGAVSSYFAFSSYMADGDTTWYLARKGAQWEAGIGTYVTSTDYLQRTTILGSSNAGAVETFTAGQVNVICGLPAEIMAVVIHGFASQALTASQQKQVRSNAGVDDRNLLINSDFRVNQRSYASAAVLAAGKYGHDRWKAGAAGGDYSFTQLASSTQITIASGKTLLQVIEDKNIEGGTYVLSWSGTAQARVGINAGTPTGSYSTGPLVIPGQNGGAVMTIEFNAGTLGKGKLELGSVPTPFVMTDIEQELERCTRLYERQTVHVLGTAAGSNGFFGCRGYFKSTKRAAPQMNVVATTSHTNDLSGLLFSAATTDSVTAYCLSAAAGFIEYIAVIEADSEL